MNVEVRISDVKTSDDTDLRSINVQLSKEIIITPVKAITTHNFFKNTTLPKSLSNLSEHFIRFDENNLKSFYSDKIINKEKNKEFEKHKTEAGSDITTISIIEYKNKEPKDDKKISLPKIPSDEEIKMLINAAYSFSDITAIPSIPRFARKIDFNNYGEFKKYLQKCYDEILKRNKKKIMGYLPMLAPLHLDRLIDYYHDLGINAFYADFDGESIEENKSGIEAIKRKLNVLGYNEKYFLHFVNLTYGKAINEAGVLTAKDLLTYAHGFDSLGGVHVSKKRGPWFYDWLKKQKDVEKNITRILNIDNYGYYKYKIDDTEIEKIYPKNALTDLETINKKPKLYTKRKFFNIENLQQQALESINLRKLVKEEYHKTITYFEKKTNVKKEDIELIKKK